MNVRFVIAVGLIGSAILWGSAIGWAQDPSEMSDKDVRVAAATVAPPAAATPAPGTVSMDLVDASLEDVLKLLSQQAGINFIAAQSARGRRVTVYLDQVPVHTAIRSILDANNLSSTQVEGSNVYVVNDSGGRPIRLLTKVYMLKYARVVPTTGEASKTFGDTGSVLRPTFSGNTQGSDSSSNSSSSSSSSSTQNQSSGTSGTRTQGIVAIIKQMLTDRGSVTVDPRTNSLAVTDVEETFPLVEEALAKLDVKPSQVFLDAEILEVKRSTLHRLGIEYGSSTGALAAFTGPSRTTNFPLGPRLLKQVSSETQSMSTLSLTNLSATLKALETEADVRFLASPKLMTLSNEVAEIRITTDAATGTTSSSQSQTGTVTTQIERNTVGTVLRVTPLITDDKYIMMVLEPEVSRVVASTKFTDFLDPDRRSARATIMVEDGETAMIAGLLSQDRDLEGRKVPILSRIPLLGAAFNRDDNTITDTEIVIFITPHIVKSQRAVSGPIPSIPPREQAPADLEGRVAERHRRALTTR